MSFWGLCSAWSVPRWLHLDSPLEEFNLHHTPRRSTLLFYQTVFRGITLAQRNPPSHLCLKADSSGKSDGSAISFQKRNIIFNFLWVRVICILWLRSGTEEGETLSELLTQWRADSDPICQPRESYPSSRSVRVCPSQTGGCVREMHHHNWTWNAISLLATEVQVDWGLSLQILISCLGGQVNTIITVWDYAKSCFLTAGICATLVVNDRGGRAAL